MERWDHKVVKRRGPRSGDGNEDEDGKSDDDEDEDYDDDDDDDGDADYKIITISKTFSIFKSKLNLDGDLSWEKDSQAYFSCCLKTNIFFIGVVWKTNI